MCTYEMLHGMSPESVPSMDKLAWAPEFELFLACLRVSLPMAQPAWSRSDIELLHR
jgi:hypothetical protein